MKRSVKHQLEAMCRLRRPMCSHLPSIVERSVKTKDDLKTMILRLKYPKRSATIVLQNWVDQGYKLSFSELRRIASQLFELKRYNHALEVSHSSHSLWFFIFLLKKYTFFQFLS